MEFKAGVKPPYAKQKTRDQNAEDSVSIHASSLFFFHGFSPFPGFFTAV